MAQTLAQLRRAKHLTQAQLADEIGISRVTINYWEVGKRRPKLSHRVLLANFFRVAPEMIALPYPEREQQEEPHTCPTCGTHLSARRLKSA